MQIHPVAVPERAQAQTRKLSFTENKTLRTENILLNDLSNGVPGLSYYLILLTSRMMEIY